MSHSLCPILQRKFTEFNPADSVYVCVCASPKWQNLLRTTTLSSKTLNSLSQVLVVVVSFWFSPWVVSHIYIPIRGFSFTQQTWVKCVVLRCKRPFAHFASVRYYIHSFSHSIHLLWAKRIAPKTKTTNLHAYGIRLNVSPPFVPYTAHRRKIHILLHKRHTQHILIYANWIKTNHFSVFFCCCCSVLHNLIGHNYIVGFVVSTLSLYLSLIV